MKIRTIRGRIVWAIVLVGCIPLVIGLVLAYVSGMRSLRDVIGGNLQAVAVQAAIVASRGASARFTASELASQISVCLRPRNASAGVS